MADHWEAAPRHMMRLDIRSLLQDAAIEEVSVFCSEAVQKWPFFTFFTLKSFLTMEKLNE